MRIDLTVRGPAGDHDVGITLAESEPLGVVLPRLAAVAGAAPGRRPSLDGRRVRETDTIGTAGLRHGAVLDYTATTAPSAGLWSVHVVAGSSRRQPTPLRRGGVTVGRDPDCDIVLSDDRVSRRHARLAAGTAGVTVHDLGATNGTSVDGVPVGGEGTEVVAGSLVRIGDSLLAVRSSGSLPQAAVVPGGDGSLRLVRAPPSAPPPPVVIDAAEQSARSRPGRVQWLAAVLPALAGGALAWVTGSLLYLLFAVVSPLVLLAGALGERLHWRRTRRKEAAALRDRRAAVAGQVADALRAETAARRADLPDVAGLLDTASLPGAGLWRGGAGLLVRAGTADLPAATQVRDGDTERSAGVVRAVPFALDLRDGAVGVAGDASVRGGVARWLVAQLAVRHAPSEVTVLLVTAGRGQWRWCRWLPHVTTGPVDPAAAAALLGTLVERRRTTHRSSAKPWGGSWTVAVIDAPDGATGALADVLTGAAAWGVTGLWLADAERDLPTACRTSTAIRDHGTVEVGLRGTDRQVVLGEQLSSTDADAIGRALAPLQDARGDSGPPSRCRLADLLPSPEIDWATSDGGTGTPLGLGPDGPVVVDLARDGPHALVAGTTGAGKSELLRSLVAGMATCHPPDGLRFLLVDYKGGAAFADCGRLPHTDGVVTDLDAGSTTRALRALSAELRRRERLFAAAGAGDLETYRRAGRPQVPRLVIVVDEFAELAAEQPGFVTGLVGVARRGRSLGVHLVLATQRPGTAITPEIRANTAIRIALRVTEPAESVDIVGVPDAASIPPRLPGRCYVRTGDGVTQVQAALIAADPEAGRPRVVPLGSWRQRIDTEPKPDDGELRRLVDRLCSAASGMTLPPPPWWPPLPTSIPLAEVGSSNGDGDGIAIGRVDLPDEQDQPELRLPWGGGVLLVGRARSGRTSALVTTALAAAGWWPPTALQVHTIDRDGSLTAVVGTLPHLGTAISSATNPDLVPRLLQRLARPLEVPTLLLLDDWDVGLATGGDVLAARWSELLAALLRNSARNLLIVATGGRSLLAGRMAGNFGTRLLLALDDASDYGLAGLAAGAVPAEPPSPGGGVRVPDGAVFRIAHAGAAPDADAARAAVAGVAATAAPLPGRLRLRPLPDRVRLADLADADAPGLRLGLAGDDAEPCVLDLVAHHGRLLVAGPPRSGRSSALLTLAHEALRQRRPVLWWAPPRSPLRCLASLAGPCLDASSPAPDRPALIVVDDVESLESSDDIVARRLLQWLRHDELPAAVVVAGRADELATGFHPVASVVRRERCGLLLRPGPLDGDLLGVRITPPVGAAPPGRGVLVADPRWLVRPADDPGEPLPVQVAID